MVQEPTVSQKIISIIWWVGFLTQYVPLIEIKLWMQNKAL